MFDFIVAYPLEIFYWIIVVAVLFSILGPMLVSGVESRLQSCVCQKYGNVDVLLSSGASLFCFLKERNLFIIAEYQGKRAKVSLLSSDLILAPKERVIKAKKKGEQDKYRVYVATSPDVDVDISGVVHSQEEADKAVAAIEYRLKQANEGGETSVNEQLTLPIKDAPGLRSKEAPFIFGALFMLAGAAGHSILFSNESDSVAKGNKSTAIDSIDGLPSLENSGLSNRQQLANKACSELELFHKEVFIEEFGAATGYGYNRCRMKNIFVLGEQELLVVASYNVNNTDGFVPYFAIVDRKNFAVVCESVEFEGCIRRESVVGIVQEALSIKSDREVIVDGKWGAGDESHLWNYVSRFGVSQSNANLEGALVLLMTGNAIVVE